MPLTGEARSQEGVESIPNSPVWGTGVGVSPGEGSRCSWELVR